jgi:hypothetical protein
MTCTPCVASLAYRLMRNHKIDMIRAFEIAEKGIQRHEANNPKPISFEGIKPVTPEEKETLTFDPDYSQSCTVSGVATCYVYADRHFCEDQYDCVKTNTCACSCPAASKPHSHYVSDTCSVALSNSCICYIRCQNLGTILCGCAGLCYYTCDVGYVWNPATQTCDPAPVTAHQIIGDGLQWEVL